MRLQKHDQQMVRRVQGGHGGVVEEVLREAAGVSPSASVSSSEDVTQMEDNFYGVITQAPRESSSSRRHMHKTNASNPL
jgi:hypothetical protein